MHQTTYDIVKVGLFSLFFLKKKNNLAYIHRALSCSLTVLMSRSIGNSPNRVQRNIRQGCKDGQIYIIAY